MDSVARRYTALRHRVPLACAVFYTGWHNLIYNRRTPDYWEESLQSFLSPEHTTALVTLPSPLLPEMRTRGIDRLLNDDADASIEDDYFNFWGEWEHERWLPELLDAHERFNAHVTDFCRRTETPLIDLRTFMQPASYDEAARDFFDVCHFRPRVYARVAAYISDELRLILPVTPPSVEHWRAAPATPAAQEPVEDMRRNIYPIW
jgi:hypothetical protein